MKNSLELKTRDVLILLFTVLFLYQCAEPTLKEKELSATASEEDLIEVDLGLAPQLGLSLEGGGLNLSTAVSDIVISLSGCATQYSFSGLAITDGKIRVLRTDKNCVAQLDSFQLDSELFLPKAGFEITNWAAGNSGVYLGQVSAKELTISVVSQLTASGATASDTVAYEFADIGSQAAPTLSSVIADPPVSLGGDVPPNLSMQSGRLMTINANGSASLDFTLECGETLVGSSPSTYECSDVLMDTELDYLLIEDTPAYGGSLTVDQADTIFSSNTPDTIGSNFIAPGTTDPYANTLVNGGFYTGTMLTGTTPIFPSSLDYFLLVRRTDGAGKALSYLYFALSIPDPNAPLQILNGSFEENGHSSDHLALAAGSNALDGWSVGGIGIDWVGTLWDASDGACSLDLSSTNAGSVSQVLTTISGKTYNILFDMAANVAGGPIIKTLTVTAAAASTQYTFDSTGRSNNDMGWETKLFTFTATSTTTILTFTGDDATPNGPALDNIRPQ